MTANFWENTPTAAAYDIIPRGRVGGNNWGLSQRTIFGPDPPPNSFVHDHLFFIFEQKYYNFFIILG